MLPGGLFCLVSHRSFSLNVHLPAREYKGPHLISYFRCHSKHYVHHRDTMETKRWGEGGRRLLFSVSGVVTTGSLPAIQLAEPLWNDPWTQRVELMPAS